MEEKHMHTMRQTFLVLACGLLSGCSVRRSGAAAPPNAPTIDALISLKRAGSPVISPDAKWVAYTLRETNWDDNVYETEIWLADAQSGATRQLTNSRKSSNAPAWSPDGRKLAFGSDREDKRQIYLIDLGGGEAMKLTSGEDSPGAFAWAPDGRSIAFTSSEPRSEALKEREKKYAEFDVIDQDHRLSHLFVIDVETKKVRRLTSGAFTVGRFDWSPDSRQIAFDHRINGDPANSGSANISVVTVADGATRAARDPGRSRQQPAVVARRRPHRVRNLDGEPEVLLHEPPHRDDPGGGRADRQPVGRVRRGSVDCALDVGRHLLLGVGADLGVSLSPRPGDEGRHAPGAHRSLDRLRLQLERRRADGRVHGERRRDRSRGLCRARRKHHGCRRS